MNLEAGQYQHLGGSEEAKDQCSGKKSKMQRAVSHQSLESCNWEIVGRASIAAQQVELPPATQASHTGSTSHPALLMAYVPMFLRFCHPCGRLTRNSWLHASLPSPGCDGCLRSELVDGKSLL